MDIKYLLFLQNFREETGNILTPFMESISEFAVGFWPFALVCVIYWLIDKKIGKWIILSSGFASLINGSILKITACVYRPWIKDPRVIPAGDAITSATGYSFPSGHSTFATSFLGLTGFYYRKKNMLFSFTLLFLMFLVLFSRNYLGVHYPQDVVVGFLITSITGFFTYKLINWMELKRNRDINFLLFMVVLSIINILYIELKPYPMDYVNGKLLVDPSKMIADAFEGIGTLLAFSIGNFLENRFVNFNFEQGNKKQIIVVVISLILLYFWIKYSVNFFDPILGRCLAKFISFFVRTIFVIFIVPFFLKRFCSKKSHEISE